MRLVKLELLRSSVHYVTEEPAPPGILRGLKLVRSRLDHALMHGWQTTAPFPNSRPKAIPGSGASCKRDWVPFKMSPQTDSDAQRYAD